MKEAETIGDFKRRNGGRTVLFEHEVKGILKELGFPVPKGAFFKRGEEVPAKLDLSFPLVAKISSSKITSKTDVGGVKVGIKDSVELTKALEELGKIGSAEGILVEEMAPPGLEVIIGGIVDNQFGGVVMFGLGGILVELFKDVAFGLAPLSMDDALWLMTQVKGHKLLDGYRGNPPIEKQSLALMMVGVSEIMATGMVREIDLNPVALYPRGAMVLDAKMQVLP